MQGKSSATGKWYYLIIMVGCCGLVAATLGIPGNATGVFLAPMAESLGVGMGDISVHKTIVSLVSSASAIVTVGYCQKVKKVRGLLILGTLLGVAGEFGYSCSQQLWQLNLFAVMVGLSTGAMGSSFVSMIIGNWFERHRGAVLGFSLCFSGISGALFSPLFQAIISSAGWRTAYRVNAAMVAVVTLPAILFMRHNPSQLSLPPLGAKGTEAATAEAEESEKALLTSDEKVNAVLLAILALLVVGSTSMASNLSNYAVSIGFTPAQGAYLISATMIGNMTFKLGGGVLVDTMGIKKTTLLVLGFAGLSAIGLRSGAALPYAVLLMFCFSFGAFYCMCGVILSNLSAALFGREKSAQMFSYFSAAGTLGGAGIGLIIGYSYDYFQSYMPAITGLIGVVAVSFLIVLTAFHIRRKHEVSL